MSTRARTRSIRLLGGAFVTFSAVVLAGCAAGGPVDGDPYRVVVLSGGPVDDKSWTNSVYDGLELVDPSLDVEIEFVGSLAADADAVQQGSAYLSQGFDMILITTGWQTAAAAQLAEQFPDATVCQGPVAATEADLEQLLPNQCVWDVKTQEGTFLAGALAALVTKTDRISAISGGDFPAMWKETEGFALGARCVNPDIVVDTQVTGSFTDVGAAQSVGTAQVGAGSDVILGAVNSAVAGIYSVARDSSSDVWVVPSYYDNYDAAPDVVLTSVLFSLDRIAADIIEKGAAGEIGERAFLPYDVANFDAGTIAEVRGAATSVVTPEVQEEYDALLEGVRAGRIVVPADDSSTPLTIEGAGSRIDPVSIGC